MLPHTGSRKKHRYRPILLNVFLRDLKLTLINIRKNDHKMNARPFFYLAIFSIHLQGSQLQKKRICNMTKKLDIVGKIRDKC